MEQFNLLMVDDTEDNLYSLRYLLEESFENINILEATNVKDALVLIMKNEIDLILSDVQMPEIDGFQFVEYLQEIDMTKNIPIILITGIYADKLYEKKAYNSSISVVDFISKPIDTEILCAKLKVFIKLFNEKKVDRIKIEKQEEILKNRNKVKIMLDNLDGVHSEIKNEILKNVDIKELLLDERELLDIDKLK